MQGTGEFEILDANLMVFFCIDSYGKPITCVPFNENRGIINNHEGRVVEEGSEDVRPNQYVVGWTMSGPRGLIGAKRLYLSRYPR